ncbi:MAG: hypothetical protein ABIJ86_03115 [Spirochaetota bacterium]
MILTTTPSLCLVRRFHGEARAYDGDAISFRIGLFQGFVGVTGYMPEAGFALNDFARAEVTRAILDRGAEDYILTNSSKFGLAHNPYSMQ